MLASTLQDVKPLSRQTEKALKDCYDREQNAIEPVVTCSYDTTFELIERGFLSAKTIVKHRKAMYVFYVTQLGIDYITQLHS